jgi:hypothetical protein
MFRIVLDDGHEHVWERIGQVTDVIVLDHCTVAGCGAGHYYDPNAPAPPVRFAYVVCDRSGRRPPRSSPTTRGRSPCVASRLGRGGAWLSLI